MNQLEEIKARVAGHTEGPWHVYADTDEAYGVQSSDGPLTWDDHGGDVFRNRADAELIAAAPKLLAALEAVEALHVREVLAVHEGYGVEAWCPPCREHWPCPTIAAITEALQ